jgi:hypothetical protein
MVWTEAPAKAKAAGQQLFPTPSATASLLDSTFADDLSADALSQKQSSAGGASTS